MKPRWPALLALAFGCSSSGAPPPSSGRAALPAGVLARAGAELVAAATVVRIAERQGVVAADAVQLAVSDALFAQAARLQLPSATIRSVQRAASARALLERLAADASKTPPTSEELAELAKERWLDVARPDAVRVTHVVVLNDKPEKSAAARALADKLALALALTPATRSEDFVAISKAFPAEGFEVRTESLPLATSDGRLFERTELGFAAKKGGLDLTFSRAANALTEVGQQSPVVETSFGFHIMRLEERVPGLTVAQPELAAMLGPDVLARRGAALRRELLDKLRATSAIQVERAADELTARVKVAP